MKLSGADPRGTGRPVVGSKLVIVTGMSGAGRTTAINALEDLANRFQGPTDICGNDLRA